MIIRYEDFLYTILAPFVPVANHIDTKKKEFLLKILFGLIMVCALFYMCAPVGVHLLIKCIIGSIILAAIIFFSIDGPVIPVAWDRRIAGLWLIFGLIRLLSGFFVSIEYLPLACVWLIEFPMFFLIWNNRNDYEVLFQSLYAGFVYPIIIFVVISLCLVPITGVGYGGLTGNANAMGQCVCISLPLILARDNTFEKKESVIFVGILVSIAFYTKSRTTTLVVVGVIMVWILYSIYAYKVEKKELCKRVCKLIFVTIILFVLIIRCNAIFSSTIGISDLATSDVKNVVNGYMDRLEGADKHENGIENYSSGRTGIWKAVIENINLFGHPSREHIRTGRNGDVGANAHNNFLQFTYDQGIVGGILFLLLNVFAFWKIVFVIDKRDNIWEKVTYIGVAYIFTALVTSINLPFLYPISFMYYVCYAVLFSESQKRLGDKSVDGENER